MNIQNTQSPGQSPEIRGFSSRSLLSNVLLILVSVGLVVWSLNLLKTRFTSVISRDAVINGVVIDLKTPSQGVVSGLSLKTGESIISGQKITTLKNERVSNLEVQVITSKLKEQQVELERANAKLNGLKNQLQLAKQEQQNQSRLVIQQAQYSTQEVLNELKAEQARYNLTKVNYERTEYLVKEGALPRAALDKAKLDMQERAATLKSIEARLAAVRTSKTAAEFDLSLDRSRSSYDPNIRIQELQLEIADQNQQVNIIKQSIKNIQAELIQAQADVKRQTTVVVKAPAKGVIWRLAAQNGKYVERGESIGQIIDCSRRWVDVFVDEQAVRSLQPGTPASIELYASDSQVLRGKVSLVRSGVGRLAAGEEVAILTNLNLPRNTQVRVELENASEKTNPSSFCYVGYTGRVTFKVQ